MSSRTVPRFALPALLVAALAAPAVAQEPRPQAPMPRAAGDATRMYHTICYQTLRDEIFALAQMTQPEPPAVSVPSMVPPEAPAPAGQFACELHAVRVPQPTAFVIGPGGLRRVMPMPEPPRFLVAPTPVPTGSFVIEINDRCVPAQQIQTGSFLIGACGTERPQSARAPAQFVMGVHLTGTSDLMCPPCPLPIAANPLNGTWYRDLGVAVIAVTFAGDEMTVRMSQREGDVAFTLTLTAHCTVTKDGLVYGAVTSADVDLMNDGKSDAAKGMELAELSLMFQEASDMPFSFRTKMTSAGLMVSRLKASSIESGGGGKELLVFGGLYKRAKDGKVPELKPASPKITQAQPVPIVGTVIGAAAGTATGALIGAACDKHCAPVERIGIDFAIPAIGQPLVPGCLTIMPPPVVAPPPMLSPVRPISGTALPPDAMKQMAADAFNQMFQEKRWHGGMTLPSPRYLEHFPQYFPPDPAFPLPRELATLEDPEGAARRTGGVKPCVVGTWIRDAGSKRCVVKVAADHLTITVSEAHEVDGKTVAAHLVITADYQLARDGMTAVGLITSADVKCDGDMQPDDTIAMTQWIGELRRALEDKPFALTLRHYGDALVIGNVRMPTAGGQMEAEPSAYVGGRYRAAGDKPLPALKAIKTELRPLPARGTPGVYMSVPANFPSSAPTGDLLPPQHLGRPAMPTPNPVTLPIPVCETITPISRVIEPPVTIPDLVPSMTPPSAPAPTMPEPAKPN